VKGELKEQTKSLEDARSENKSLKEKLRSAEAKIANLQVSTRQTVGLVGNASERERIEHEILEREKRMEVERLEAQRAHAALTASQHRQSSSRSLQATEPGSSKPAWATGNLKLKGTSKGEALKSGADIHFQAFVPKPIEDMNPLDREKVLRKHTKIKAMKNQAKALSQSVHADTKAGNDEAEISQSEH